MRPFQAAVVLSASMVLAVPAAAQEAFVAAEDAPETAADVYTAWGHDFQPFMGTEGHANLERDDPDRHEGEREDNALPPGAQAQATFPRFRTVLVGPIPGDPVASGTRLLNALASINPTSCPGDNWRLWIAPGVYDLGGTSLAMKPCVDIEGAGERATKITAAVTVFDGCEGTVIAASNAELRMLTIESTNAFTSCALSAVGASPKLVQVTLLASGTMNSIGLDAYNASSLSLTHVTITASGPVFVTYGIAADASSLTLADVTVVASGGQGNFAVSAQSSTLIVYRSRLAAAPASLGSAAIGSGGGLTARVAHSQLEGGLAPGIACIGNYDANLAPVTCP